MQIIKFSNSQRSALEAIVLKFDTYSKFSANKKAAYSYAELFQISVCPYCNINYIDTIHNTVRPEFDHFTPKSLHQGKGLELAIDNLIPACHICNSNIKRNKLFEITTHIHPFYDDFDSIIRFTLNIRSANYLDKENFDILFTNTSTNADLSRKASRSISDLKLYARYQARKNSVIEYLKFIAHYNSCHRKQIFEIMHIKQHEHATLESLLDGYLNSDINNTSLGKLRKDIIARYSE